MVDIFVHPEHARTSSKGYVQYLEALKKVLKESADPYLVGGLRQGPFDNYFSPEKILESQSLPGYITGHVKDIKQLERLDTPIILHGSWLGECIDDFVLDIKQIKGSYHGVSYGVVLTYGKKPNSELISNTTKIFHF